MAEIQKPTKHMEPSLNRVIGLPMLVLYGLGITIGAGIYVLIGEAAAEAGEYAPSAFLFAAFVMAFSALSFAELSGRIPQSSGEAAYVDAGFGWSWLTLGTGLLIVVAATVAAAAISIGCAGYVAVLLPLPQPIIVTAIVILMGLIAIRGVAESVFIASLLTIIEIIGLLIIVISGFWNTPEMLQNFPSAFPPLTETAALKGVLAASLVAFFAFIGFDDVVNMVEETRNPKRTMVWAIFISLLAVTVIYFLVVFVAVQSVQPEELAESSAPIGLLFERLTGLSPWSITLIAIIATINGVLIEMLMASRVIYGLGKKGRLPAFLARVSPGSRIPRNATILVVFSILILALFVPLGRLVDFTSQMILIAFTLINMSLILIKLRGDPAPEGIFIVPLICPIIGVATCAFLLIGTSLISAA